MRHSKVVGSEQHSKDPEASIRDAWERGDLELAATRLLESYGPEVQAFLVAFMSDRTAAREAFSLFARNLWEALPQFEWRCTARGWAYTLARNAARRHVRDEKRRRARHVSMPEGLLSEVAAQTRTRTDAYLKTEVKDRMQQLRRRLSAEDQQILILRVSRQLSWLEMAMVFNSEGSGASHAELEREARRLRKRFQLAKDRLREVAREEGLTE
jgi:RNA polymerase sigma-70 factor (ECF subfamily)